MNTPSSGRLRVISVVVQDNPGVLSRVSGMIRRRGFNIEGLSVGPTDARGRSRMTLTVDAGYAEVDQVEKQLDRLIEVIEIEDLTDAPRLSRELALVKLAVAEGQRARVTAEVERIGGRLIDAGAEQVIVEISGELSRVEAGLAELRAFDVVEMARSGPVAMSRGG